MGSWLAALRAGAIPKINPTVAATPKESSMEVKLTMVGILATEETTKAIVTPSTTPINPPLTLIMMASNKNCCTTSTF